ncbi:hypothetical protein [Natronorubrum thiooxidans]|uniref:Uncharacterized protein n=1 Tax=Natronorubrum thiooxidans TaxID=308853 RepID=A0A1N7E1L1_9EURY|nr:hypothetical protein [Natronorubrum thiooxidans]SIR81953.1 hypothetical protein SAMN05421752_103125 [Natronorubrum thiooxidans]
MSVIRQPGLLGRTTRRRVVGVTAALSIAMVEAVAVGLWFGLVVGERSTSTALAGLGILFCGALLRAGVFGATVSDVRDLCQPQRLAAALALTGGWVVWLLVAELVGNIAGLAVATVVLTGVLTGQFVLERHVFPTRVHSPTVRTALVPALLLAVGAATLLASAWFTDLTLATPPLSLEITTIVLWIDVQHLGYLAFGLFAFLAHQQRFEQVLDP